MNQKQLTLLIVLAVLIGGAGIYLYQKKNASLQVPDRGPRQKLLGEFPINDITQVEIKQGTNDLKLVKKNDLWRVPARYDYPANFTQIREFINKVYDLKGVQRVAVGKSLLPRLELSEPGQGTNSGTLVEFKDNSGKLIRSLLLGKKHLRQSQSESASPFGMDTGGWPDGRFVLVTNGTAKPDVWVVSEPFSNIETKPDDWLNKDFIKVDKLRSVSVTSTNATNSWKLTREVEGGEMKLADAKPGEELDTSKISGVNYLLSSPNFTDVLSPETKPESIGMDKPVEATLNTFDGFTYNIKIGKYTNDENYPFRFTVSADLAKERTPGKDEKPADKTKLDKEFKDKMDKLKEKLEQEKGYEKWTYLMGKWTIDSLLKPRSDLIKPPKKEEPKTNVVSTLQTPAINPALTNDGLPSVGLPHPIVPKAETPKPVVTNAVPPVLPATKPPEKANGSTNNAPPAPAPGAPPVPK